MPFTRAAQHQINTDEPFEPLYFIRLSGRMKGSIGHWSFVICHWGLVIGHWGLVIGHLSLVIGHWGLGVGHWVLVIGCLSLVIGHWLLVIGWGSVSIQQSKRQTTNDQ